MPQRIQIVIGILLILVLIGIIHYVRSNKLNMRFALLWILAVCVMLVLDIWPRLAEILAGWVGIELPLNMLLFLGIFFLMLLVFGLTSRLSKVIDETKRLAQELALLKKEIETGKEHEQQ